MRIFTGSENLLFAEFGFDDPGIGLVIERFGKSDAAFAVAFGFKTRDRTNEEDCDDVGQDDRNNAAGRAATDVEIKQGGLVDEGTAELSTHRPDPRSS